MSKEIRIDLIVFVCLYLDYPLNIKKKFYLK